LFFYIGIELLREAFTCFEKKTPRAA